MASPVFTDGADQFTVIDASPTLVEEIPGAFEGARTTYNVSPVIRHIAGNWVEFDVMIFVP